MPRVYISPSTQENNRGVGPFTNEEKEMNAIADHLMRLLNNDGRFEFRRNSPFMNIYQCAKDSNDFKADIHVAIHSNAGGGEGTEVWAYGVGTNSERLSKFLYEHVAPLSPGKDRGVKFNPKFLEIGNQVNASSALIEVGFHDNKADATWIVNNHSAIAQAIYRGICDYFKYNYPILTVEPPIMPPVTSKQIADDDIYLSVRVREHKADQLIKDIKKMGYACERLTLA